MATTVIHTHKRTNIFVIDSDLWAWAQYRAKVLGIESVSTYVFDLIKLDKEKDILASGHACSHSKKLVEGL
jgi:hypothetical protein